LTILRVARQHYRVFWAGITLLTSINGQPVLPRVVAMSGTIKKLQNRAVGYHRLVTGQILVAAVERAGGNSLDCQVKTTADGWLGPVPSTKEEETRRLEAGWAKEMAELQALED